MRARQWDRVLVVCVLLVSASCSATPPGIEAQTRLAEEPIQLKVTWWGSPTRDMRTQQVLDMFTLAHPNITFTTEHYANTQAGGPGFAYWPTMNQYANSGGAGLGCIMQHDYAYIADWTQRGLLEDLGPFVGAQLDLSDVPAKLVDGGRVNGILRGVSLGTNTQAIVVDLDVLKKVNAQVPADDWTKQDFKALAMKIHNSLGIFGAGQGFYGYTPGWKAIVLSMGQWVWSADGKSLGYTDDNPWTHDWHLLLSLEDAGAIPTLAQEPGGSNVENMLLVTGQSAMESLFSNQLVALWNKANTVNGPRHLKLLPLPKIQGGVSPVYLKPSQYFVIPDICPHPEAAAQVIDFFTNSIEANQILKGERGVPIANRVLAALQQSLDPISTESFDLVKRATAYATALPPIDPPAWDNILTTIFTPKVTTPIMNKTITPEDGVALFRREASAALVAP